MSRQTASGHRPAPVPHNSARLLVLARLEAITATVRSGATVGDAAREQGLTGETVGRWAKRDPAIAAALRQAYADRAEAQRRPHGSQARYDAGCRCQACRAAHARVHRELRRDRKARRDSAQFRHGASAYSNWGCRCETCTTAAAEAQRPYYRRYQESPKGRAATRRLQAGKQAVTTDNARRHRQAWTSSELETVGRDDLTVMQIALMLGRTYAAVATARQRLGWDPQQAAHAAESGRVRAAAEHRRETKRRNRQARREEIREYNRRWRAAHREQIRDGERRRRAASREQIRERQRRWRAAHPEQARERDRRYRPAKRATDAARQARTVDNARRHGYVWTGPELELTAREDLTIEQIALMLGRSYYAVKTARRNIRTDPRYDFLAGLARQPGPQNVPATPAGQHQGGTPS
jgi:hypothetical protein